MKTLCVMLVLALGATAANVHASDATSSQKVAPASCQSPSTPGTPDPTTGTLSAVVGGVQLSKDGKFAPISGGQSIKTGDSLLVQAGGSATISYATGCSLNLEPGITVVPDGCGCFSAADVAAAGAGAAGAGAAGAGAAGAVGAGAAKAAAGGLFGLGGLATAGVVAGVVATAAVVENNRSDDSP